MFEPSDEHGNVPQTPGAEPAKDSQHPLSTPSSSPTFPSSAPAAAPRHVDPLLSTAQQQQQQQPPYNLPRSAASPTSMDIPIGSSNGNGSSQNFFAVGGSSAGGSSGSGSLRMGGGGGNSNNGGGLPGIPSASISSPGESYVFVADGQANGGGIASAGKKTGAQFQDDRDGFAKFKVGAARMGDEAIKPLTYFPVKTTPGEFLINGTPQNLNLKELPQAPYHGKGGTLKRTNKWQKIETTVERRYSEFVDFRALLCLLFPMLPVPPLPPKKRIDDLNTFMQSADSLRHQRLIISHFCNALNRIPEMMLFCEWVPPFLQMPRNAEFVVFLGKMRETLSTLKLVTAPIITHSALGSNHSLMDSTGQVMKSVVSSVMSWFDRSTAAAEEPRSKTSLSKGELAAAIDKKVEDMVQYSRWMTQIEALKAMRKELEKTASNARKWINLEEDCLQDMREVALACGDYGLKGLAQSEHFKDLSDVLTLEAAFLDDVTKSHAEENIRRVQTIQEALFNEANWADSMVEQLDFMICLWKRDCELTIESGSSQTAEKFNRFCLLCNDRLEDEMKTFHRLRQKRLAQIGWRHVHDSIVFATKELNATEKNVLPGIMARPDFTTGQRLPQPQQH